MDTFNAENLNGNGTGNHAMWCGVPIGAWESKEWIHEQGYGNRWNASLIYESGPVPNTSIGQTVDLDFFFNHDSEPEYDYFIVEYDLAGNWTQVYAIDGTNADSLGVFSSPGVQYSTVGANPIVYVTTV